MHSTLVDAFNAGATANEAFSAEKPSPDIVLWILAAAVLLFLEVPTVNTFLKARSPEK
jgi:hypothetical protein